MCHDIGIARKPAFCVASRVIRSVACEPRDRAARVCRGGDAPVTSMHCGCANRVRGMRPPVEAAAPATVPWCGGYCARRENFDLVYADATPHISAGDVAAIIARTTMTRATNFQGGSMAARKKAAKRGKKAAKRGKKAAKRGKKK